MKKVAVKIDWLKFDFESIRDEIVETQFYAFVSEGELQYVGKSYRQHVNQESKQSLRAFDLDRRKVDIYTGLVEILSGQSRITSELISDIERLLVYTNQPMLNSHYVNRIEVNRNLTVYNRQDHMLVPNARSIDNVVYVARLAKGTQTTKWLPFTLRTLAQQIR